MNVADLAARGRQDQVEAEFERGIFAGKPEEVRLSKGDAAKYEREGTMPAFLACLARWAERMTGEGYMIGAEPLEGPGTMVWKAMRR